MCGLVGAIGDLWNNDKKAFTYMLMLDTVRGPHSTGVAYISDKNRNDVKIVKDIDRPWELMRKEEFWNGNEKRDVIGGNLVGLMGHNRWATVGNIVPDNAHPFEAGKIIGMQNGTLPEFDRKKLVDYEFYDTDTEALMFNIDLKGVENVIPTIQGAWALTWYNREEDTFNILRNKERPLFYAWKKNGKVLYYASEAWMIYAATEKFGIDLLDDLVYHTAVDTHYKYKIGDPQKFGKHCLTTSEVKGWEYKKSFSYPYRVVSGTSTNNAKESANVFTSGGKNSTTLSPSEKSSEQASFEYWNTKRDQFFEFTVGNKKGDEQGKEYLSGQIVNGGPEVRLYPSVKDPDLYAILGDPDALTFAGKVKKVKAVGRNGLYVTMNNDTVMIAQYRASKNTSIGTMIDNVDAANNQNFVKPDIIQVVANGKSVTPEEFNKMVNKGCAWCSSVPSVVKCKEVIWLGNSGDFLCDDCSSNEEITQYAKQFL